MVCRGIFNAVEEKLTEEIIENVEYVQQKLFVVTWIKNTETKPITYIFCTYIIKIGIKYVY